jgi:hypothetical protein
MVRRQREVYEYSTPYSSQLRVRRTGFAGNGWLMTRAPDLDALGGRLSASCGYAAFVI